MQIRPCQDADIAAVAAVFTASVHELAASHYDAAQREAWAPRDAGVEIWVARLSGLRTLLAVENAVVGAFIAYAPNGHIEFLYTAAGFQRRGFASALYRELEKALPGVALFTEASLLAKPFFLRHGFTVVEEQDLVRNGLTFRRFAMRKAAQV